MKLITYNPFLSRWADDTGAGKTASVNIVEKDNGFYVDLVSPGFDKSDFKIELHKNQLTVSAEKKNETEAKENDKIWRREYTFNSFKRSFYLPETVEGDAIEANYEQGILKLFIPKKAEAIPAVKTIEIA